MKNNINEAITNAALVILDFDGTLVNLETDWIALKHELRDYCYRELKIDESFENIDAGLFKIRHRVGEPEFQKLLEIVSRRELEGYQGKYIEMTVNILRNVKDIKKIAIFSSNCRKTIKRIVSSLPVHIDFIVAKEDVTKPKPCGEGIRKILQYFGMKTEDAIFIGDSENDIKAGNDAGVKAVLLESMRV
ncbi:MAG: HAD-IA family hydrolase [Dissulfurispiraceae bacterium]|jgi:HAD superfamily hydrolase (TIGR01509 family)